MCPFILVAQNEGSLLPKLQEQFAEFLQRSSLKRLGILYQSTCVGFEYGLCGGYFLGPLLSQGNPISPDKLHDPSPSTGPRILTWFPSITPFGLTLGTG